MRYIMSNSQDREGERRKLYEGSKEKTRGERPEVACNVVKVRHDWQGATT